ncbi:hypothetical protein AVO41_07160 [Thiomicrospira sp. WB1]|nr:hypothetical protein AVO41_07160 [Thiomicrospira sp. WB1]
MTWLYGLTGLLVFQLLGEMAVRLLHLPVPGPVVGMLLLLGWLFWRGDTPPALDQAAKGLLNHLSLLFVPAGVGAMIYLDALMANVWAVVLSLTLGTVLTLMVTAWVSQKTQRRSTMRQPERSDG